MMYCISMYLVSHIEFDGRYKGIQIVDKEYNCAGVYAITSLDGTIGAGALFIRAERVISNKN